MTASESKRLPIDQLLRRLRQKGGQLERLFTNSQLLAEDIFSRSQGVKIVFCVDFYDLRVYLAGGSIEKTEDSRTAEDNARVLFFNRLQEPPVLLPPYYLEFGNHLARLFPSKRRLIDEKNNWVASLLAPLRRIIDELNGLVSALEIRQRVDSETEISDIKALAAGAVAVVNSVVAKMHEDHEQREAAGLLHRFDALLQNGRLVGIKEFVTKPVTISKSGKVYSHCKSFLDEHRPRLSVANDTDASALATIVKLNELRDDEAPLFYFVSGSPRMRELVADLNEKILPDGGVELRDIQYWALWFSLAEGAIAPELDRIREFRAQVNDDLESLVRRNRQLQRDVTQSVRQIESAVIDRHLASVSDYLDSLAGCFASVFSPVIRGNASLLVLEDMLQPLRSADEMLGEALRHIHLLVEELGSPAPDLEAVKIKLRALLVQLERIVWILEGDNISSRLPSKRDSEFLVNWSLQEREWDVLARELLAKADSRDPDSIREVFQALPQLKGPFERYVVAARAYLDQGELKLAENELRAVDRIYHDDPEFLLTEALLSEKMGKFDEAQRLMETLLLKRYDVPMVRIHLAALLRRKGRLSGDRALLDQALVHAEQSYRKTGAWPLQLRIESTVTLFNILADFDNRADRSRMVEALAEVDGLLQRTDREFSPQELRGMLKTLKRRLRRQLGISESERLANSED
jgi:tetratricopeptide (TPR) repeat protein